MKKPKDGRRWSGWLLERDWWFEGIVGIAVAMVIAAVSGFFRD